MLPGLQLSMGVPRLVHAHTQTHPPSFIHIHTHLSEKCTFSLILRTCRWNELEEVPLAPTSTGHLAPPTASMPAFGDSFREFSNISL